MRVIRAIVVLASAAVFILSCGEDGSSPTGPEGVVRSFALGFTDFPHALSGQAVVDAHEVIRRDADMAVMHFDDGIPWQEALTGAPYDQDYLNGFVARAGMILPSHLTYLAITPIGLGRASLAGHRGAAPNEPLEAPWDSYAFDAPQVTAAFVAHCNKLIDIFSPDYFAYAIEANILYELAPEKWTAFVGFCRVVYPALKASHPNLPIFLTIHADTYHGDPADQGGAIAMLLSYTDMVAVSTYPFTAPRSDPGTIPGGWFSDLAALAPAKPFAVSETAWPAEDVTPPAPISVIATPETQRAYTERLLAEADSLQARFVVWFFTRDYDEFWETYMQYIPEAWLVRLWKDSGMYDGAGSPRPALTVWRTALARPRG